MRVASDHAVPNKEVWVGYFIKKTKSIAHIGLRWRSYKSHNPAHQEDVIDEAASDHLGMNLLQ